MIFNIIFGSLKFFILDGQYAIVVFVCEYDFWYLFICIIYSKNVKMRKIEMVVFEFIYSNEN